MATTSNSLIPPTTPVTPPGATLKETQSSQPSSQSSGTSTPAAASGLYLYTFLATLVLLLCVSAAIIIRSLMMRVRNRRLIEEAIRNGTYVAPGTGTHHGRSRRNGAATQPKPVFFDAYLDWRDEYKKWEDVLPVAAAYVKPEKPEQKEASAPSNTVAITAAERTQLTSTQRYGILPYIQRLHHLFERNNSGTASNAVQTNGVLPTDAAASHQLVVEPQDPATTTSANVPESKTKDAPSITPESPKPSPLRVMVLIAMPDPSRPSHFTPSNTRPPSRSSSPSQHPLSSTTSSLSDDKGKSKDGRFNATSTVVPIGEDGEVEVPHVEFGVAEVKLVGDVGDVDDVGVAS